MRNHYVKKALSFLKRTGIKIEGIWIDCGCGRGTYAYALSLLGADTVVAIDINVPALTGIQPPIRPVAGDCHHLPVKEGCVNGVSYVNVLHYYEKPHVLVQEAHRVLEKTGYIIIIEYDQRFPTAWDPHPLAEGDIELLLQSGGFEIVEKIRIDAHYRPKHLIIGEALSST